MYGHQRADIRKIMDTSRQATPLMREWMRLAESQQTDLGYEDWKAERRKVRRKPRRGSDA